MRNSFFARKTRWAAAIVAALAIASGGFAQETIEQRLDRLEKANADLQQKLALQQQQLQQQQLQQQNAAPAAPAAPGLGFEANTVAAQGMPAGPATAAGSAPAGGNPFVEVGSNLNMSVSWKDGLLFQTPNKDFIAHIGGWDQYDNYWWTQSGGLVAPKGAALAAKTGIAGPATGGIGDYQDGDYFRRIRFQFDGTINEVFEWNWVFALENIQYGSAGLDEFWVGITKVPLIGNLRAGHIKIAEGLEGDQYSSSRTMTFLEKASITEAFYQNFGTGLWMFNDYKSRIFWAAEAYRQEQGSTVDGGASSGDAFGDGAYSYGGRLAALPLYTNEGRCLVHVGASYFWRKAQNSDPNAPSITDTPTLEFRARPELRDNNPVGNSSGATVGGVATNSQGLPLSNNTRMVDTGSIPADSEAVVGLEGLVINGPFSLMAEYAFATAYNCTGTNAKLTGQDLNFNGGYVAATYFLTGENRGYDTRLGRMASNYIQGGPRTPFWLVRGQDGGLDRGLGAWELAGRLSYLDLNDGNVNGGTLLGAAAGLNWYLTNNMKVQFQYQWNRRESLPVGVNPGDINGFATRVQVNF